MTRTFLLISFPTAIFALVCAIDIMREGPPWDAVDITLDIVETLAAVLLVIAVVWAMQRISDMQEDQSALRAFVTRNHEKGADWRAARSEEIAAISDAIALEFRNWGLTDAEMGVAELLLKGASLKDIALDQRSSVSAVRATARSIYQKAGISGRVELSTYFLDSMFDDLPTPDPT